MAHGLRGSMACGIFPDQGRNLCLLPWQVDSLPLSHQGSPEACNLNYLLRFALILRGDWAEGGRVGPNKCSLMPCIKYKRETDLEVLHLLL